MYKAPAKQTTTRPLGWWKHTWSCPRCMGLHSFTLRLNVSALYGIGVARRGSVRAARAEGVLGGV